MTRDYRRDHFCAELAPLSVFRLTFIGRDFIAPQRDENMLGWQGDEMRKLVARGTVLVFEAFSRIDFFLLVFQEVGG